MRKKTRSILHELNSMIVEKDRHHVLESRATNVIESAINLINEMHKHYDETVAGDLERRLLNSIKHLQGVFYYNLNTTRLKMVKFLNLNTSTLPCHL